MDWLDQIRDAEAKSHTQAYTSHELYTPGSWLAKPVKTVLDLLPLFAGYKKLRVLDLGCGVGRNSIPVARNFRDIPCLVEGVDILPLAIEKLQENSLRYEVAEAIQGVVSPIDAYEIKADFYDFIMAISALEHMDTKAGFVRKLEEISHGLRKNGVVCLIVNTGVQEWDKASGEKLRPQFEVNWKTQELLLILKQTFKDWKVIKSTVTHQKYDIPRNQGLAQLESDVVTWVVRNETL